MYIRSSRHHLQQCTLLLALDVFAYCFQVVHFLLGDEQYCSIGFTSGFDNTGNATNMLLFLHEMLETDKSPDLSLRRVMARFDQEVFNKEVKSSAPASKAPGPSNPQAIRASRQQLVQEAIAASNQHTAGSAATTLSFSAAAADTDVEDSGLDASPISVPSPLPAPLSLPPSPVKVNALQAKAQRGQRMLTMLGNLSQPASAQNQGPAALASLPSAPVSLDFNADLSDGGQSGYVSPVDTEIASEDDEEPVQSLARQISTRTFGIFILTLSYGDYLVDVDDSIESDDEVVEDLPSAPLPGPTPVQATARTTKVRPPRPFTPSSVSIDVLSRLLHRF